VSAIVLRGDAAHLPLPDESVDLIVTSPPYFGLRSYTDGGEHYAGQIGSEATPREYIANLLDCTCEWMRVLKPEGSIFVNLGDKYATRYSSVRGAGRRSLNEDDDSRGRSGQNRTGVPEKSLLGLPWRYALGCTDDLGLILRRDVIWSKPNSMPESVTDRCRSTHEYLFHLTKQPRYFAGVDEIREAHTMRPQRRPNGRPEDLTPRQGQPRQAWSTAARDEIGVDGHPLGKLPGSVWEIPSQPLAVPAHLGVDHFAAFPMELPRRIILGWSPSGICTECGEGRRPVATSVELDMSRPQARRAHHPAQRAGLTEDHLQALLSVGISDTGRGAATQSGTGKNAPDVYVLAAEARAALGGYAREYLLRRPTAIGYECACPDASAPTCPAVVVDPFGGTGTTALVASVLGRTGITVDRSADYCRLATWRTTDPGERARAMGVPKPPPVTEGQGSLFNLTA
jgi:DNA modification methylase